MRWLNYIIKEIQSTLVIAKSKGLSEYFPDISDLQNRRKKRSNGHISQMNMYFDSYIYRYFENIVEKRRNCSLGAILLFSTIFYYLLLDFNVKTGTRFSLRDKRLLEISGVDITRFDYSIEYVQEKPQ